MSRFELGSWIAGTIASIVVLVMTMAAIFLPTGVPHALLDAALWVAFPVGISSTSFGLYQVWSAE